MLKVTDLSKAVDAEPLFEGVSFVLNDGERAGLVGPNGVGKSTLLRIIAGQVRADEGSIQTGAEDRVGYLPQEATDFEQSVGAYLRRSFGEVYELELEMRSLEARLADGADDARLMNRYGEVQERFTRLDGWLMDELIDSARERVSVDQIPAERTLGALSGGEQARVMMAAALMRDPTVLLLDEPTNHLDLEGILWLEGFVCDFPGSVLVVSHDRRFLDRSVGRIFELDGVRDEMQFYVGGYSDYKAEKQRRWERWLLEYEAQEKYRKRLEADIDRTRQQALSTERSTRNDQARRLAAKVAKKAKSRERRLAQQMKLASWIARPETRPRLILRFTGDISPDVRVLNLSDVRFSYGDKEVLAGVDLEVRGKERCAIVGANGSGKSTLLRIARDRLAEESRFPIGYLPQDQASLPMERSALEFFRSRVVMHEDDARALLDRFLFEQHQLRQPLRTLSAGERTRLALAALVSSDAECLLLDEPTNHLDFDSLDVVTEALADYRGTLVLVSHDRQFLRDIGIGQVVALRDGRRDDDWARELGDELRAETPSAASGTSAR